MSNDPHPQLQQGLRTLHTLSYHYPKKRDAPTLAVIMINPPVSVRNLLPFVNFSVQIINLNPLKLIHETSYKHKTSSDKMQKINTVIASIVFTS